MVRACVAVSPSLLAVVAFSCFSSGLERGQLVQPSAGAGGDGAFAGHGGSGLGANGGGGGGLGGAGGSGGPECICGVTCDWGSFGAAAPVPNVSSEQSELDPHLASDGLTLYFASTRPGGLGSWDIWAATRATVGEPFGEPVAVTELSSSAEDVGPDLSGSGLIMFFASAREGGLGSSDLWYATRSVTSEPFATPAHVSTPNSDGWDADPAVSADRLTLYFATVRGTATDRDLWVAVRPDAAASFDAAEPLTLLNSSADDYDPSVSADELELYFSTERGEQRDIWVSRRSSVDVPFAAAVPVAGVNTDQPGVDGGVPDNEWSPGISPDGRTLYFVTDRDGVVGVADIWSATRSCP